MKELYASAEIGITGLLFFFAIFVGVAIWAYLPRNKQKIEAYKQIPLKED
jgi:cbb3-type cytochrome oxidase subunit 3